MYDGDLGYSRKDTIHVFKNVSVPEPYDSESMFLDYSFSFPVIRNLSRMLPSINFDDELVTLTAEISDIRANNLLSFELHSIKPAIA